MEQHFPYEGAGFFLQVSIYNTLYAVLGQRIKKEDDLKKDPSIEIEYFGGKPEEADQNDPFKTAIAELTEEVGGTFLDDNWRDRIQEIPI